MRTALIILSWLLVTGGIVVVLGGSLLGRQQRLFLPGHTTSGHFQLEDECSLCHTPLAGVKQEACTGCHGDELDAADDSHPPSKFLDPRSFAIVEELDARLCVTCHREHRPGITGPGGASRPPGFCETCHADIEEERPSHRGLSFETCSAAGCHNFHDNRALNQDFLEAHQGEPDLLAEPVIERPWVASHEIADISCADCHGEGTAWSDYPGDEPCAGCHQMQATTFRRGRHGMRPANGLSGMRPELARLPMHEGAEGRELGCTSCHSAHAIDRRQAAVDACLGCHADRHSLAYLDSPHSGLWTAELMGVLPPGSGVSCATCHLPRLHGEPTHDQSAMMRPVDKMLRPVCSHCHGVDFALDALVDPAMIERNFRGRPAPRVKLPAPGAEP